MATCGKCKRSLSDPESIKRGFGPLCWAKVMAGEKQEEAERRAAQRVAAYFFAVILATSDGFFSRYRVSASMAWNVSGLMWCSMPSTSS